MLPQANARVTAISGGGNSTDYDYEGGSGAPLWAGEVDGYVSSTARLVPGEGRLDRLSADFIVVDEIDYSPSVDEYVTYVHEGDTYTRKVVEVGHRAALPGIPHTHKLYLESE